MKTKLLWMLPAVAWVPLGCPVWQDQDTPVDEVKLVSARAKTEYWLYVPSYYRHDRDWPLVVTLHGTHLWDSYNAQIREWKRLAEDYGFIVAAPKLSSVQGILPVASRWRRNDVEADERAILDLLDDVASRYRVDRSTVLLTGFSAGGYPLYYTAARHPEKFLAVAARACNSDLDLLEAVPLTEEFKNTPMFIYWGKDDLKPLRDQSWQAYRYFRERGCNVERDTMDGGHIRRPRPACEWWRGLLPAKYRRYGP